MSLGMGRMGIWMLLCWMLGLEDGGFVGCGMNQIE